jgi:hypothetical protein
MYVCVNGAAPVLREGAGGLGPPTPALGLFGFGTPGFGLDDAGKFRAAGLGFGADVFGLVRAAGFGFGFGADVFGLVRAAGAVGFAVGVEV